MQRNRVLFGTIFTVVLLAICLFTTFIFIKSFGIVGAKALWLYVLAVFVSAVFVIAFVTSRHSATKGRNAFYIFAMTLGGYGMYLFIVSIPLAIILAVVSFVGKTISHWIPIKFFVLALILGIIGHIQSWFITTKKYTVTIPNLPEWWYGKRAVLVTDTHFGLVRKDRFAKKIVAAIEKIHPDVIFHGGDFYDGPDIKTAELTAIWKTLADTTPIFYTPGNHEKYGNYKAFIDSLKAANIHVLEDAKTTHEGMQIAGITYRTKKQSDDAARAIRGLGLDNTMSSILINHPPLFHDLAVASGIDLMLSGHSHNGQFWPGTYFARMVFGKYAYGKYDIDGMTAITSRGVGTAGPPFRLFNSPELVVIEFQKK